MMFSISWEEVFKLIRMFIKKEVGLNFWNVILIILSVDIIYLLFYVIIGLIFKDIYQSSISTILLEYFHILLYVPAIFWMTKKTNTNIKESYFIPELSIVIKMLFIAFLARIIVLQPLDHPDVFFKSLMNSELRFIGTTTKPCFFLLDIRLIFIVPIVEELFFRGLVLKKFLKRYSPMSAILLSSLLFGVYHLNFDNLIILIPLGILLGVAYYVTKSVLVSTLMHMLWNAFSMFNYDYIELNMRNSIPFLFLYITAFALLILLLRNRLKTATRRDPIDNSKN